ncbi:hypothetical protein P2G88_11470 [Aliiglaciecola sp. CAU 1673]|uniref:hypothetical protein n=1 Tax=Aliiglaciecola sp. CAU 1673 TaxID=3032595 RepID=UPI0023DB9BA8|nr:hypothetical protein [Aliiglaciecola sp. CAU 1673]MDF2178868.1 hypothetical protein [Aliiglaciecola sp. CAU 1673]
MPSSTSSSDNYYRQVPEKPWGKMLLICLLVTVIGVSGWEWLSRTMQHEAGTYQDHSDAMWAEERRKLDKPDHSIRMVLTGSSRMLWGADLDILEQAFGTRPLQLSLPGTSPAIFVKDIVENTDFDGVIVVGVTPFLFNWIGPGYFGKDALDVYHNQSPSHWVGTRIHRFLSDHLAFLDEAFSLVELVDHYVVVPERAGAKVLNEQGWKLGNAYADRQMDMWAPVEVPGSFDNRQVINFWMPGIRRPIPEDDKLQEMADEAIAFFKPLISTLRARGGEIIFIRMPSSGEYLNKDLKADYRHKVWDKMVDGWQAMAIDSMDYPELSSELDIPEWSHLSRASQDLWSERIATHIKLSFKQYSGHTLEDILKDVKITAKDKGD